MNTVVLKFNIIQNTKEVAANIADMPTIAFNLNKKRLIIELPNESLLTIKNIKPQPGKRNAEVYFSGDLQGLIDSDILTAMNYCPKTIKGGFLDEKKGFNEEDLLPIEAFFEQYGAVEDPEKKLNRFFFNEFVSAPQLTETEINFVVLDCGCFWPYEDEGEDEWGTTQPLGAFFTPEILSKLAS